MAFSCAVADWLGCSAHKAFRARRLERELREHMAGYPSAEGGGQLSIARLPILQYTSIGMHNMMHFAKRGDNPDYKVECAPILYARYAPCSATELHEQPKPLCHFVALTAAEEQGGGLWFGDVLLLFSIKLTAGEWEQFAYVEYLQQIEDHHPCYHQLSFPCFRAASLAEGAFGLVPISEVLWLAPMVPDPRDGTIMRLNVDAWV